MFMRQIVLTSLLLTLITLGLAQAESREIVGHAVVTDGDTIKIAGNKIRLNGFDAPETKQTCSRDNQTYNCGLVATEAVRQFTAGQTVRCLTEKKDQYGRWIARCLVNGKDIGAWMVSEGYAVAYRQYSMTYVADEGVAKENGRGLWSGAFVMPWEWRRGKRLSQATDTKQSCNIKGNISRNGKRIYHTPDSPWYSRTKINEARGERWFCSEDKARAAGWRPAKH